LSITEGATYKVQPFCQNDLKLTLHINIFLNKYSSHLFTENENLGFFSQKNILWDFISKLKV